VPARYEQGVHRAHRTSITRSCALCPSRPRHRGRRTRDTLVWLHVRANACIRRAYSAPLENTKNVTGPRCPGLRGAGSADGPAGLLSAGQPVRIQAIGSALADPGHRRLGPLGLTGRKVLAITPGATGAVVVMALPAWNADHAPIFSLSVLGWMFAMDFVIGRRQTGRPVRRRWRGASGAGARPPALPRSGRPTRRTSRGGTVRN